MRGRVMRRQSVARLDRLTGCMRRVALGQLRLLDVLNERRRLIETRLAHIDAETELAQAAADLERAVGMDLP